MDSKENEPKGEQRSQMESQEMIPRSYQTHLMRTSMKENSIIYLPTGSGKTHIAILLLKEMIRPLQKSYAEGGKIGIMLVNTVPLVGQHTKTLKLHTSLNVEGISGEMNVDFWIKKDWQNQCMAHNMFVMTGKILENALKQKYIDLNRIHLLIFDECHHAVDAHTMREIMKEFEHVCVPPRVLGLTATLLNRNVKANRVLEEVTKLEVSLHSKVASVDNMDLVSEYSTNPTEYLELFDEHQLTATEFEAIGILSDLQTLLTDCQHKETMEVEKENYREEHLSLFESPGTFSDLNRIVKDTIWQIERLGTYGGHKAIVAHHIQLQYIKLKCVNAKVLCILKIMVSQFVIVKKLLENAMKDCKAADIKLLMHSSDKVCKFLHIVEKYAHSTLPLCALVFVERRFTAQILYHILKELALSCESYSHIKCDYVVGFRSNPLSNTRYGLFESKINSTVIQNFADNTLNLLVCTNLMEEGVDLPQCLLVVKFDEPNNYRSYVQSKGRTRHREGKYVIMTSNANSSKHLKNMVDFRAVEKELKSHLVNSDAYLRVGPSAHDIKKMYRELELPPYYVDGPQSAHVSMNGAVALVHIYVNSLPSDQFTKHEPLWFKETNNARGIRVILELPTGVGHLLDTIKGDFMANQLKAKQACALEACILLHQMGELDYHLCPKEQCTIDADTDFLFTHWPATKEQTAGNTKTRRKYTKTIPSCMTRPLASSLDCLYIHVVDIEPIFIPDSTDLPALHFHRMFSSDLCFGFITVGQMPNVCSFPLFVSNGEIKITIRTNVRKISLTQKRLQELYVCHYMVFNGVLEKLHGFLSMNSDSLLMNLLLAPVERISGDIRWDIVEEHTNIKPMDVQPSSEDIAKLVVTEESYTDKIVSKWYRNDSTVYLVLRVTDLYPSSPFKTADFGNFNDYFHERYRMKITNQEQPLLLVKAISSRLNCLKPRGESSDVKRKRNQFDNISGYKENFDEELVPEFLVKQEYPGELWIQAKVMPSVIHRLVQLLRAEELRQLIAKETGMGEADVDNIKPLAVDIHLVNKIVEPEVLRPPIIPPVEMMDVADCSSKIKTAKSGNRRLNNVVFEKKLDSQYPWNAIDEPVDIHRNLDVPTADIMHFYKFINYKVSKHTDTIIRPNKNPAIKYDKDFQHKDIAILKKSVNSRGPDLKDIYQVLASKKCDEIVNLERLETLGDSFLKLAASLYIWLKYPQYCEGKASTLKSKLISNKNLYYCGIKRNLGSLMLVSDLDLANWLPPSFGLTEYIRNQLSRREIQPGSLFHLTLSTEEQIGDILTKESQASLITLNETEVKEDDAPPIDNYLGLQEVPDKTIADCVEAILGAYCQSCGFEGGLRILEWLSIIPSTECLTELLQKPLPSPILVGNVNMSADMTELLDNLLPNWEDIEESIGYHFKSRAYLLQALTHATYTNNRITRSYERLEFIGDAVLDYLITMYIYEYGNNLDPGELTDLRSALVNNETFAAFAVRLGLHKSMKYMNALLQSYIGKYVEYMESVNYEVNSKMLVFINDCDVNSAENIDVPKALGDIFESVIGAIYLDSGMNMDTVWQIVYKIMYKEIDLFSACVPKNPVRLLYEKHGAHPKFLPSYKVEKREQMVVPLEVTVSAARKMVHGYGANKKLAKKAAAKIALCLFD